MKNWSNYFVLKVIQIDHGVAVKVMVAVVVDLEVMVGLHRCKEIRMLIMEIRVIRLNKN